MTAHFRLDGRVALITGGAGIYGSAMTEALAEAGARVIVASRDRGATDSLAERLRAAGGDVTGAALDLASAESVTLLRDSIAAEHERLDVLVNNAVARVGGDADTQDEDAWARAMEVNSTGLYRACRTFGALMTDGRGGSIVNVASIHGVVAPDFRVYAGLGLTSPPDYAFAKGGVISLTRYLAAFWGPRGIRVNALSPGGCRTDDHPDEFAERYAARTMLGRMGRRADVKGPLVFLASDASGYVTGHNLLVDGGLTCL
jgi:NAD(P)-dependent dehydrogenase (short-subunit alcohol dehydrogenase family)